MLRLKATRNKTTQRTADRGAGADMVAINTPEAITGAAKMRISKNILIGNQCQNPSESNIKFYNPFEDVFGFYILFLPISVLFACQLL
mmetsp:Transcript_35745/g.43057  ORF Transcript_35745/g.43057 Transcript_35745/m.43057 type:complete len:88 (+) Transcript_35745:1117-1380(+)